MDKCDLLKLIKLPNYIFSDIVSDTVPRIGLRKGQIELGEDQFVAVGLEKSKAAQDWEDTDYFNVVILTKASDQKYYLVKIEHPADVLSPKYIEDELNINWVGDIRQAADRELIGDLYSLNDSRCEYTLTVSEKPYSIYEKYLSYKMSVSYEIWEDYYKNIEASPFLIVRCQLSSRYVDYILEELPKKILEYKISVLPLLQASVFKFCPFKIWDGNVTVDGVEVTLSSK